ARVGVRQSAEFQVDDDEASKRSVKEDQVDPVPRIAHAQSSLSADEREVPAELEEEVLEVADERLLDLGLRIFVLQTEELEYERILDLLLWSNHVLGTRMLPLREHCDLVPGKGGALIEHRFDLTIELAKCPTASKGLSLVEPARRRITDGQE